jgi:hypothetical protein
MRAPDYSAFAAAVDEFCRRYPEYDRRFFDRVRQCKNVPPARVPTDYLELAGSLCVAWTTARRWPQRPEATEQLQKEFKRRLDLIRPLLKENWLDPWLRDRLSQEERICTGWASYDGEIFLPIFEPIIRHDLPQRRDTLTFTALGREYRGAGPKLFVREVSLAMRAIWHDPYDKVVGELAGLAFETKALSPRTVQSMCKGKYANSTEK